MQDKQCNTCQWYFCGLVGAHNCDRNVNERLNYIETQPAIAPVEPSSETFIAGQFEYKCQGKKLTYLSIWLVRIHIDALQLVEWVPCF